MRTLHGSFTSATPHGFKQWLLSTSGMLALAIATPAYAAPLIPSQPSVEVNLGALESLRPQAFVPPVAAPVAAAPTPVRKTVAASVPAQPERQRPVEQPPAPAPAPTPVAPAPAVTQQASGSIMLPPPLPPLAAAPTQPRPAPVVAPAQVAVPLEVVKPVAAPATPLPRVDTSKPHYADLSKPGTANGVPAPAEVPKVPPMGAQERALMQALDTAAKPMPAPLPKPVAATPAAVPAKETPKLAPLPAAPAASSLPTVDEVLAGGTRPAPAPAPAPVPAEKAAPAPVPAPPSATIASPPPATMVVEKPKPVTPPAVAPQPPVLVADKPAAAKDDPMFKNLSERANSLFMKEPEKQGIVSDKTAVTGEPQTLPKPPAPVAVAPKPAPAPVAPKADAVAVPAVKPAEPAAAKTDSMVDKLAAAASHAPSIAVPPAVDTRGLVEKPPQLSLQEVNKKSPPESMHAPVPPLPAVTPATQKPVQNPIVLPKATDRAPVLPEKNDAISNILPPPKPVLAATQPAPVTKEAAKEPAKAAIPPAPVVPEKAVAKTDPVASILPPKPVGAAPAPAPAPVAKEAATPAPAPAAPAASAAAQKPALPSLPVLGKEPPLPLPSLTAITGEERSSMDIAQDSNGVRAADLTPPKPAMIDANAPDTLPKVVRGTPGSSLPPFPDPVPPLAEKPVEAKAEAKPVDAPAPKSTVVASLPTLPPVAEQAPAEPKPASVARTAKPEESAGKVAMSLTFAKDKSDVDPEMKAKIANVAKEIKSSGASVRVVSYATGTDGEQSTARRIALSRALQVRALLMEQGVDQFKIVPQALGNAKNTDQVDLITK